MAIRSTVGYDQTNGDVLPLHSLYSTETEDLFPGFVNDASHTGTGDHAGGDYTIVDDSAGDNKIANIARMPAEAVCYDIDIFGTAYPMVTENDPGFPAGAALPGGVQ